MTSYRICGTCGTWVWFDERHTCPPLWVVAPERHPEDMLSVRGADAEEAARAWAERYDSDGDYHLAKGNEMVVLVGRPGGDLVRVSVEGETVPHYRVRELGPAQPQPQAQPGPPSVGRELGASSAESGGTASPKSDSQNHTEGRDQ